VNSLFALLGIESWKPLLSALLLPPVPFLLAILVGARVILARRAVGWSIVLASTVVMWLTTTVGFARAVERSVLHVPPPLGAARIAELRAEAKNRGGMAVVVLGAGVEPLAPEYGLGMLTPTSLERLVFGAWLSRETGAPLGFSGGTGWAQRQGASEAEIAARIASRDLGRPLKWIEDESRDTHENAARTVPLLQRAGIGHILLVTHGWHLPRAQHAFDEIGPSHGIRIEAAPMGLGSGAEGRVLDWMPTTLGMTRSRQAVREAFARLLGA
jgi:uncharacterized SAM-binding protein YcdF (DUF218 family)